MQRNNATKQREKEQTREVSPTTVVVYFMYLYSSIILVLPYQHDIIVLLNCCSQYPLVVFYY